MSVLIKQVNPTPQYPQEDGHRSAEEGCACLKAQPYTSEKFELARVYPAIPVPYLLNRHPYPLPDKALFTLLRSSASGVVSWVAAIAWPFPGVLVVATPCHRPLIPFTAVGRSTRSKGACCCPKAVSVKEALSSSGEGGALLAPLCCR